MSVITRITRRFTYPVESPFTSLTLYYGVLIGAACCCTITCPSSGRRSPAPG